MRKEIRRSVVFGANNLVSDAPVSRIDLAVDQVMWTLSIPALKRSLLARPQEPGRQTFAAPGGCQLPAPHGGRGRATLVATPLVMGTHDLGAILLFEDTTRPAALTQEKRELKERLKR